MKKNNKKGFTIVELVIVIAVIAILAAVLIPTFSSVIKKAKVNNDIQLVRNLNTALATDNKKHKTMQSALDAAAKFGYDVAKINASATDNEILWDSKNDVFCYLNTEKNALEYIPSSVADDAKLSVNSYLLWKISDAVDKIYSTYYTGKETKINTSKGFDAGTTKGITEIKYENNTDQKVVIRTNSFDTTLTINDSSTQGKIYHYDNLGKLIITDCAMESYHEMGIVGYAELQKGHLAVEENASINLLFANSQDPANLKITNNGTITNAQASSDSVEGSNTISGVDFNRENAATVSDVDIQKSVQETHQSNCEHANIVVSKEAKDPTCTETGLTAEESCADCHKVLIAQEVVSTIAHTLTHTAAKTVTCTEDGNVEYWTCSVCNKLFSDAEATQETTANDVNIPATGSHTYVNHQCNVCRTAEPGWEGFAGKVDENGKLQESAFSGDTSIATIAIPEGVKTIGRYAFYNCTSLESVTIPSTVTSIEDSAFQGCSKLKSVTIPSGVKIISYKTFYECKSLSEVTLPDGLTSIQQSAFASCTALKSISIPDTLTTIGQSAFSECAITSITIPASVTTINTYVFQNCTSLEKVNLNATITQLPDGIFCGCSALKTITIPANVTTIGTAAFQGCSSLARIIIPDKVTSIGAQAFQDCTSLTTITIPESVTSIGKNAFKGAGLTTAEFKTTSGWNCTYYDYVNNRYPTRPVTIASGASETNANLLKGSTYNDPSFSRK